MKKFIFLPMVLSYFITNGQNLVPNPSFEDTVICPNGLTQIANAVGWSSYRGTPDYFNSCALSTVGVPQNSWGFQNAYDGNAYVLIGTYSAFPFNNREYFGIQLLQPLVLGAKYFLEAYVSRSDSPITNGVSNNLGFRFSNTSYTVSNPAPLDNFSHYRDSTLIVDSVGWTKISGSFIADSMYQYIMIGNFYDDLNTDTLDINGHDAGYYIDFICVSTDSLECVLPNGINQTNNGQFDIVPNPVIDEFRIINKTHNKIVIISDLLGNIIMTKPLEEGLNIIRASSIAAGMYLIFLDDKFYKKVIVQH